MPLPLSELFTEEDYRFNLTLRKGDLIDFFRAPDSAALDERRQWLERDPTPYVATTAEAEPLLAECWQWASAWSAELGGLPADRTECLLGLARGLGPDFMLLSRETGDAFRLQAAAVCFPSSWVPAEKVGLTLDAIHQIVPGLNASIGGSIGQFLSKLRPGLAYERANWGLAATPERNMHPALQRPRLTPPADPANIWVRIEDQILAVLPQTGAVLFGIRLRIIPLPQILDDPAIRRGFQRAFMTLPTPMIHYKGLAGIHADLVKYLV